MSLRYESEKGYQYRQRRNGAIQRVSASVSDNKVPEIPKVGNKVKIIIKPYVDRKYIIGIVQRVLTKKKMHSRGHKVKLQNGVVGRVIFIFKKNNVSRIK